MVIERRLDKIRLLLRMFCEANFTLVAVSPFLSRGFLLISSSHGLDGLTSIRFSSNICLLVFIVLSCSIRKHI